MTQAVDNAAEEEPASESKRSFHLLLFLATCLTTFLSGAGVGSDFAPMQGLFFSATLMAILSFHEMGHYLVARAHGIHASLPYFIPMPPVISFGTMGAVIRMDDITDRKRLLDVGAAGPLAGLVVALPLLWIGLQMSEVAPVTGDGAIEGNSLAYAGLKYLIYGRWLPSGGMDVQLHPMAFAAWVGLLITMINLLPVGQLDGGHIACAALGERHERFSRAFHFALPLASAGIVLWLLIDARRAGMALGDALWPCVQAGLPWLVWALLLVWLRRAAGGRYHPPVANLPLGPGRRLFVGFMFLVFLLLLTPVPLRSGALP